jgi:hypothetical protein
MRFIGAEKPQHPSAEYYPNSIGSISPGNAGTYAFLVLGRDDRTIQSQVLNAFYRHGAKVLSQVGYVDYRTSEFTLCINCDLTNGNITPDDFVIELRRMKSVSNVLSTSLKDRIFDGFLFPMTFMNKNRVVAVNSALTFQLRERLKSEEAKFLLQDVGREFALDVVRQVKRRLGSNLEADIIRENVRGYFRAAGWGSFTWDSEASFERVTMTDPPTSSKGEAAGNFFLQGMACGLVEAFQNRRFKLAEEVYNADARSLTLMLSEQEIEPKEKQKIRKSIEIKALEEVEKVIKSVQQDEEDEPIEQVVETSKHPPLIQIIASLPKEQKQRLSEEIVRRKEGYEKEKSLAVAPTMKSIKIVEQRPHVEIVEDIVGGEIHEIDEGVERVPTERLDDIEYYNDAYDAAGEPESEGHVSERRKIKLPRKAVKFHDEDSDGVEDEDMWFDPVILE